MAGSARPTLYVGAAVACLCSAGYLLPKKGPNQVYVPTPPLLHPFTYVPPPQDDLVSSPDDLDACIDRVQQTVIILTLICCYLMYVVSPWSNLQRNVDSPPHTGSHAVCACRWAVTYLAQVNPMVTPVIKHQNH